MPLAEFPELSCGSVAQYPSRFAVMRKVTIQRTVDGLEQRFVRRGQARRRWQIRWQQLSEADAVKLREFFEAVRGRATGFRFRDPWTGQWHEPCWFESDAMGFEHRGTNQLRGELTITTREV
jgi:uncharacterized protein (TIGR02217 family)